MLLCSKVNRLYVCIYIPSLLGFFPIKVTIAHQVEFPVLYSRFSLVICFKHRMYVFQSQSPSSPHPLSIHVFVLSICVSLSALQVKVIYTIFLDFMCMH